MATPRHPMATPSHPALHERRRTATRDLLQDAALDLFESRGYRATTVDDIADAVGISARTFFRYFATKDAVLVVWQREASDYLAAQDVPPGSPREVLLGLHRAMDDFVAARAADGTTGAVRFRRAGRVLAANPELHAAELIHIESIRDTLLPKVIAALGPDVDATMAHLVLHLFGAALTSTLDAWCTQSEAGLAVDLLTVHRHTGEALATLLS